MKNLLIVSLCAFFLWACKKDDQPTLTEMLAANDWGKTMILVSADSISDTVPNIDILTPKDSCDKDNIWRFFAATNTFQNLEGATKCSPAAPDIKKQGTIEELDNGARLRVVDGGGTEEIWEIESFTGSSFRTSYFARNGPTSVKFRVVFTKL